MIRFGRVYGVSWMNIKTFARAGWAVTHMSPFISASPISHNKTDSVKPLNVVRIE